MHYKPQKTELNKKQTANKTRLNANKKALALRIKQKKTKKKVYILLAYSGKRSYI